MNNFGGSLLETEPGGQIVISGPTREGVQRAVDFCMDVAADAPWGFATFSFPRRHAQGDWIAVGTLSVGRVPENKNAPLPWDQPTA